LTAAALLAKADRACASAVALLEMGDVDGACKVPSKRSATQSVGHHEINDCGTLVLMYALLVGDAHLTEKLA
jgi:hypothetical protein